MQEGNTSIGAKAACEIGRKIIYIRENSIVKCTHCTQFLLLAMFLFHNTCEQNLSVQFLLSQFCAEVYFLNPQKKFFRLILIRVF